MLPFHLPPAPPVTDADPVCNDDDDDDDVSCLAVRAVRDRIAMGKKLNRKTAPENNNRM